jgi:fucose 4-O-acetylase-like acetyltransferase
MPDRRYDVDWLRIFATFLLFPFHIGKVFDGVPFYPIASPDSIHALIYFTGFVHLWHMPLFFALAGWSLHASIARRGGRATLRERVDRLLVPFLACTATVCLVIGYYEKVMMPGKDIPFLKFVPLFFTSLDYFSWSHLWFLIYLLVFTLLWWPLLQRLSAREGKLVLRRSWYIYLPIPALFLMQGTLRIWWPGFQNLYNDWGNFCYYSAAMIFGYLIGCQPSILEAIDREWKRAACVGATAAALVLYGFHQYDQWTDVHRHLHYHFFGTVAGFTIVVALLGFGRRFLNVTNRARTYLAESALPVYILHQAAIVIPGWYIMHWRLCIPARIAILLLVSVSLTCPAGEGFLLFFSRRSANGIRATLA